METLANILERNGHTEKTINLLKIDIEGSELDGKGTYMFYKIGCVNFNVTFPAFQGLEAWLDSGALQNVQQIQLEIHLEEGQLF